MDHDTFLKRLEELVLKSHQKLKDRFLRLLLLTCWYFNSLSVCVLSGKGAALALFGELAACV